MFFYSQQRRKIYPFVRHGDLIIIGKKGHIRTTTPEGETVFLDASHINEVRELLKRVTGKDFFHSGETDEQGTVRYDSRLEKDEEIDWSKFFEKRIY